MKKICMIVPSFTAKGGIAAVVNGYRGSELEKKYAIHYIETYCDGTKPAKLFKAVTAYLCFIKELIVFKPDIIHIHSSFGASFYRKLPFIWMGSVLKIPIVNHIHGSELKRFFWDAHPFVKALKKKAYQSCDMVIALTEEWKTLFIEAFGIQTVKAINNYGRVCSLITKEHRPDTVLFMGFLSKLKGCMDIPEIVYQVKKEIPRVQFILAGKGSCEEVRQIEQMLKDYGIQENVQFPGWITGSEKESALQSAVLFLLPSYTEGMPMSILEAMGHGLPIVSSNVGGIPELVEQGRNGYMCDPGDTKAFADAIVTLLKDAQLRNTMGKESIRIIEESYSLEHHIDALASVYESSC